MTSLLGNDRDLRLISPKSFECVEIKIIKEVDKSSLTFTKIYSEMDKSWITKHRLSQDYISGVNQFLDFAFANMKTYMIKCPCQHCCLVRYKVRVEVEGGLFYHGFRPTYTNWYLHGEELDSNGETVRLESESRVDYTEDLSMNLLEDVFPSMNNSIDDDDAASPTEDHPSRRRRLMIC
ncbi:unnamed protein product [Microthlaspi erraticum]|uniref:Transposase-associated domain-containing protein n=1 Tax=Microthlaspi erraticum TaxID=1685480 RepID=A0A6D2JQL2_9BRAS|nr:unnamed protein product [Microthlaspi erraticum]